MATVTKAANAHTAVSGTGFTNPSNAYATTGDNVYATAALTSTANTTVSGDFGFPNFAANDTPTPIPDYSTITSVVLNTEYAISATVTGLATGIQIYRDGAAAGTEVTRSSLTEAVATQTITSTAGAASAAWIADLRAASTDIKGRVRITKGNTTNLSTLSLDYISLTVNFTAPSSVTTLSALSFTAGSLSPSFASGTTSYTVGPVAYASTATTTFTATATAPGTTGNTGAKMEYRVGGTGSWSNLTMDASGNATSPAISLTAGTSTTVEIRVTAEDGVTVGTPYTVVLTRRPAPLDFQTEVTVDGQGLTKRYSPSFSRGGVLVASTVGTFRWYNDTGVALTIKEVRASVGTAPTGASLILDVNVDGSTIWSTTGNRVTITAGNNTATQTTFNTTSVPDGSYLTVDIDQVGSTVAGSDLTVTVWLGV